MTIAAGFRCVDGVVLCTDSEYSGGQYQAKSPGPKIFPVHPLNGRAYIAGSGDTSYLSSIAAEIIEKIGEKRVRAERVKAVVGAAVRDIFKRDIIPLRKSGDPNPPTVDILLAMQVGEPAKLYRVKETGRISPANTNPVCSGMESGEAAIKAIASILFQDGITSIYTMPAIAMHLIISTGDHAMYCGGAPQVVGVSDQGDYWEHIYPSSQPGKSPLSDMFLYLPSILNAIADRDDEALEMFISAMDDSIKGIRDVRKKNSQAKWLKKNLSKWTW